MQTQKLSLIVLVTYMCCLSMAVCQELQELVNQQLNVIQQTSNALNQCCHGNSAFAGSAEAVECHRLLLVACELSLHGSYCVAQLAERWSLAGELTLSCARPAADG